MRSVVRATRRRRLRYQSLWLAEHFARTLRLDAARLEARRLGAADDLREQVRRLGNGRVTADRRRDLDPETFRREYLDTDTPVVLEGAAAAWACCRSWTPELFRKRYGQDTVRILRLGPSEVPLPGTGRSVTFAEVVDSLQNGGGLYSRFAGLMHRHPELLDDLDRGWLRRMRRGPQGFEFFGFFLGGAGTATGLHSAFAPNLFVEVVGRKRWYIYPATFAPLFVPPVKRSPYFYSTVDVTDVEQHAFLAALPGWECELGAGDVLYVPAYAWHQVHNDSATIAVGYRWTAVWQALRSSFLQTFLAVTSTNPPPWKAHNHTDIPDLLDSLDS